MRRFTGFVLAVLCAVTAYADGIVSKELYAPHEPIVLKCDTLATEGQKSSVVWNIPTSVKYIETCSDVAIWAPPGSYTVEAIAVVTQPTKVGEQTIDAFVGIRFYRAAFIVGNVPDPTPPPPIPVPPGPTPVTGCDSKLNPDHDRLASRVCGWLKEVPQQQRIASVELAALYNETGLKLRSGELMDITKASAYLVAGREKIINTAEEVTAWQGFQQKLASELASRWPLDREQMAKYYIAVGDGLR